MADLILKKFQLDRPTLMYFISLQSKSRKQQYLNVMITEGHKLIILDREAFWKKSISGWIQNGGSDIKYFREIDLL